MSWAPGAHLIYLLGIILAAELLQSTIRPYENPIFNQLEAQALGVSALCLALVLSLLVEWPFMPYAIFVTNSALLFLTTAAVYTYFIRLYVQAALAAKNGREPCVAEASPPPPASSGIELSARGALSTGMSGDAGDSNSGDQ